MQSHTYPSFDPAPNQTYKICSYKDTGKALTIQPGSMRIIIQNYSASPSQHFHIYRNNTANNRFAIVCDDMAVRILDENASDGAIVSADIKQYPSSYFEITPINNSQDVGKTCFIKTFCGKVLDVKGGFTFNNTEVCQWQWHSGNNQVWVMTPVIQNASYHQLSCQQPLVKFVPNKIYAIYAAGNAMKALDVSKGFLKSGDVIIYSYHGGDNQKFCFEEEGALFRIRSVQDGKYIAVHQDDPSEGSKIRAECRGSKSELWSVIPAKSGEYTLQGAYHIRSIFGKALDVGINFSDDTQVRQCGFKESLGQMWIIRQI